MARPFSELREAMSPERQAAAQARTAAMLEEMSLTEARQALNLTQEELAKALALDQSSLSKAERRSDMHVSKLRAIVEAMGGELVIVARFPGLGDVRVNQFDDLSPRAAK